MLDIILIKLIDYIIKKYYFLPRVNSCYGRKSLSYLRCKLWKEITKNFKDQGYFGMFNFGVINIFHKSQSGKC